MPSALVLSPKFQRYVQFVRHATPPLVVVLASKVTMSNMRGAAGLNVNSATKLGFDGRITPGGISIKSSSRAISLRKSPWSSGVTRIVTLVGTWPVAAGARKKIVVGVIGFL